MKSVQLLVLFACVAGSLASSNVLDFSNGFFAGLQVYNPKMSECISHQKSLETQLPVTYEKCKDAESSAIKKAQCAIAFAKLLALYKDVASECDLGEIYHSLKNLATEQGLVDAAHRARAHTSDLVEDGKAALAAYKAKEFTAAGVAAGKLVAVLIQNQPSQTVLDETAYALTYPAPMAAQDAAPRPFVVFHGIGDQCSNSGMKHFVDSLVQQVGSYGVCIEIGNGAGDSWQMAFDEQVKHACASIKADSKLANGFNTVGLSQGGLIARAVAQQCDGVKVYNVVSIGGPQCGVASVPKCTSGFICNIINGMIRLGIYSSFVQHHVGPAGYFRDPFKMDGYLQSSVFLADVNNERSEKNQQYKDRLASLESLVLIKFEKDSVIFPRETSWFGSFPNGHNDKALDVKDTPLYGEDWIGLKGLIDSGKVQFVSLPGDHLQFTADETTKYIVPALKN